MPPATSGSSPQQSQALRTLAHPLRSRLLAHLRIHGPATASELARALETHTGATSYHLRRMAEADLIEDTGTGIGRRRVWQAPSRAPVGQGGSASTESAGSGDSLDEDALDEDDAAALEWLAMDYADHFRDRCGQWIEQRRHWPAPWKDSCGLDDGQVLVTGEQLAAMRAELDEVLSRYRRLGQGNPQARRVVVYTCPLPIDQQTGR